MEYFGPHIEQLSQAENCKKWQLSKIRRKLLNKVENAIDIKVKEMAENIDEIK